MEIAYEYKQRAYFLQLFLKFDIFLKSALSVLCFPVLCVAVAASNLGLCFLQGCVTRM